MPPIIALLLCSAFVSFLLKLDYRRFKARTIASLIPTIWLLYCSSKPLSYWLSGRWVVTEDLSARVMEGNAMDRTFLSILILVGLLILAKRRIEWRQVVKDNRWLFLLFFYMLVSILWSDYPFISLKRWIKASGTIVMALVVLTGPFPLEEIKTILRRIIYISIPFSVLLVKYFPNLGRMWGRWSGEPMWVGVTMGKNTLGVLCMISALFLIWTWAKRRKQTEQPSTKYEIMAHAMLFGMTLWLLKGSGSAYSATSLVVLIIGLITLFMLRWRKISTHLVATACLCTIFIGSVYPFTWRSLSTSSPMAIITSLTGRSASLTGRGDMIWDQLTPIFVEHAVLGKGYGGFWINYLEFQKHYINEAHNGYLDILLKIGIVGLVLFTIVIASFIKRAIDVFKYDMEWGSFLLAYLLISLLHNITESSFLVPTLLIWNLFVLFIVTSAGRGSMSIIRRPNSAISR